MNRKFLLIFTAISLGAVGQTMASSEQKPASIPMELALCVKRFLHSFIIDVTDKDFLSPHKNLDAARCYVNNLSSTTKKLFFLLAIKELLHNHDLQRSLCCAFLCYLAGLVKTKTRPLIKKANPLSKVAQITNKLCRECGIRNVDVFINATSDINAGAGGSSRNNYYIIVTSGLLNLLNDEELEAVLAHELGHIKHGHCDNFLYLSSIVSLAEIGLAITEVSRKKYFIISACLALTKAILQWPEELEADEFSLYATKNTKLAQALRKMTASPHCAVETFFTFLSPLNLLLGKVAPNYPALFTRLSDGAWDSHPPTFLRIIKLFAKKQKLAGHKAY